MKACGGMYIQVHAFLTWALRGGVWSASQIVKIAPSVYSEGWVDPMDGLDTLERRKISFPCSESDHSSSVGQPRAYKIYSLYGASSVSL